MTFLQSPYEGKALDERGLSETASSWNAVEGISWVFDILFPVLPACWPAASKLMEVVAHLMVELHTVKNCLIEKGPKGQRKREIRAWVSVRSKPNGWDDRDVCMFVCGGSIVRISCQQVHDSTRQFLAADHDLSVAVRLFCSGGFVLTQTRLTPCRRNPRNMRSHSHVLRSETTNKFRYPTSFTILSPLSCSHSCVMSLFLGLTPYHFDRLSH